MKKQTVLVLVAAFLAVLFISSCNPSHVSPVAITSALGATGCQAGPVVTSQGGSPLCYNTEGIVVNTQAEYDAASCPGWAPAGTPTPAQEPVDFATKTLIGIRVGYDCGTSAGMTGVTTDCNGVYINMFRTTECSMYHCNSFFSYNLTFTIDKTSLPIYIKTDTRQCDGSIVTYMSPQL